MKRMVFFLFIFLNLSCRGGDPTGSSQPVPSSKIAIVGEVNFSTSKVFTVNPDGTELLEVSSGNSNSGVSWAPDGKSLIYVSSEDYPNKVYRVDADGENRREIGEIDLQEIPKWSPDGSQILLKRSDDLVLVSADNGDLLTVVAGDQGLPFAERPTYYEYVWFPDGSKILFTGDFEVSFSQPDLYTINTDGSNLQRIYESGTIRARQPKVSPDGSKIVFVDLVLGGPNSGRIYQIDADGSNLIAINEGPLNMDPEWSPDGTKLAFYQNIWLQNNFNDVLAVLDATNNFSVHLARDIIPIQFVLKTLAWAPDSRHILIRLRFRGSRHEGMGYININSGQITPVMSGDFEITEWAWSPEKK